MTVEAAIYAAIKPLVADKCFPDVAPFGTVAPWAVYQQVGGEDVSVISRTLQDRQNGRFQISFWGKTRAEVAALALAAEDAMIMSLDFDARAIGSPVAVYENDTLLYGTHQHFSVWSSR